MFAVVLRTLSRIEFLGKSLTKSSWYTEVFCDPCSIFLEAYFLQTSVSACFLDLCLFALPSCVCVSFVSSYVSTFILLCVSRMF
jgi:hypothetical protein